MPSPPFGSAIPFQAPIDLNQLDLENAKLHMVNGDVGAPQEGQIWYNYSSHLPKIRDDTLSRTILTTRNTLDTIPVAAANVDLNSRKIVNLLDPTNPQDAATKNYADSISQGLDTKLPCRAGTTTVLPTCTYFPVGTGGVVGVGDYLEANSNGAFAPVDGVSLIAANQDRILVKNQASALQNGLYTLTVQGDGATKWRLVRATDADTGTGLEVTAGMFTFVSEGAVNSGTGWTLTTLGAIVVGTTAQVFAQFSSAGHFTGSPSIDVIANVISIATTWPGQAALATLGTVTTGVWNATPVGVAYGGTGAVSPALARAALNVPQRGYVATTGGSTVCAVSHTLNTTSVIVQARYAAGRQIVYCDIVVTDASTVTLNFTTAPSSNSIEVLIIPAI